jgi:transcriptional regulator GlxA family with amidase domain
MPHPVTVAAIALPDCMLGGLFGIVDFFAVANTLADMSDTLEGPVFDCRLVSVDGNPVTHSMGMHIDVKGDLAAAGEADLVYIPALNIRRLGDLRERIAANYRVVDSLPRIYADGAAIAASCTGSMLLAEAGLLDGRQATTTWWLKGIFQRRYPAVRLRIEDLVVQDERLFTAGASSAYLNLALLLAAQFGDPQLAALCSKTLLVDPNRASQAPYAMLGSTTEHGDELVARVQFWMQTHLQNSIDLGELAALFAISERTLIRRFKQATGETPTGYFQQVRVEAAKRMLESTELSTEAVTERVGYSDLSSFRRLFKKITHLSPGEYRKRFASPLH